MGLAFARTVTLHVSAGHLELPARREEDVVEVVPFLLPEAVPTLAYDETGTASSRRFVRHELTTGRHVLTWDHDPNRGVRRRLENGLEYETVGSDSYAIVEGRPTSAVARTRVVCETRTRSLGRPGGVNGSPLIRCRELPRYQRSEGV